MLQNLQSLGTQVVRMVQYKLSVQLFAEEVIEMNSVLCDSSLVL